MGSPNPRRPCHVPSITSSSQSPSFNQSDVDLTISSFLSLSNLPLFSSPLSISCSFERVLDKIITTASGTPCDEFDQDRFLDRTLQFASLLHDSTKRCIRKRTTLQNSISWLLPPELTIKVFSMLDTKSLIQASASCTMFNKCALDRVCYSHIDLTMPANNVDNGDLCIMIHRAGRELRSLKLDGSATPLLTRSCLSPLSSNHGFAGGLLKSLHLYNLISMDRKSLCSTVLPTCPNLTDLKIVGFAPGGRIDPAEQLALLTRNCRLIEHLFVETFSTLVFRAKDSKLVEFMDNSPNLMSLSLLRFGINDTIAQIMIKGFRQLKYIHLSRTNRITGCFLRALGDNPLETLILHNCSDLKETEVLLFLNSLLTGDFKSIHYIDVSSKHGLVSDGSGRTYEPKFPIEELRKERPGVTFVAIFGLPPSSSGKLDWDDVEGEEDYIYDNVLEEEEDYIEDEGVDEDEDEGVEDYIVLEEEEEEEDGDEEGFIYDNGEDDEEEEEEEEDHYGIYD